MIECDDTPGQRWKLTRASGQYYQLTSERSPQKCLDILNDAKANNQPILAPCAKASGQLWQLSSVDGGHFSLTTSWRGDGKCLDIVKDRRDNARLLLADCANTKRQQWKVAAVAKGGGEPSVAPSAERRAAQPPARDPHRNAVDPRSSFEPQFVIAGFQTCDLSLRDFDTEYSEERSTTALVACTRTKQKHLLCKLIAHTQSWLKPSRYVFDATMTKDTASALAFAGPSPVGSIDISANPKLHTSTMTVQTLDGASVTCPDGAYVTAAEMKQFMKKWEATQEDDSASTPSRSDTSERERDREPRPAQPGPKLKTLGQSCESSSECKSGKCKPVNAKRSTCN